MLPCYPAQLGTAAGAGGDQVVRTSLAFTHAGCGQAEVSPSSLTSLSMARVSPHSCIQETLPPAVGRCREQGISSEGERNCIVLAEAGGGHLSLPPDL